MLQRFFEEIKELKNDVSHRSALRIHHILENNKNVFLKKLDPSLFNLMLRNFEDLANTNHTGYFSDKFKDDFSRHYEMLYYNLNKVI